MNTIELTEYEPAAFASEVIAGDVEAALAFGYDGKIAIDGPTLASGYKYRLTSLGWVGYIPLLPDVGVSLRPKTPIGNLFRMLEYAYSLSSFHLLEGTFDAETLDEFYERLANVLAKRILDRVRVGLYRTYEPESDRLSYIRGRMDVAASIRAPWTVNPLCHFQEHTPDTEENRILAWTMYTVARTGRCGERVLPAVRQAYRKLTACVKLEPQLARSCVGRLYSRLNDDYQPLHMLCRFFLENTGPSHETGDRAMLPFLVNMNRLFEKFVAEWLASHLPARFRLEAQETVTVSDEAGLKFNLDLMIYDRATDQPVAVLDTKYKTHESVAEPDFYQIVTYAKVKGAPLAALVYPTPLVKPLDSHIDGTRVRGLAFPLAGDLEAGGQAFLADLLGSVGEPRNA